MNYSEISKALNIDRRFLFRLRLKLPAEIVLDDGNLLNEILDIKARFPHFGEVYVKGALRGRGFIVTRQRIRESLRAIDGEAVQRRRQPQIIRQPYSVPGVNHIWHLDGNEKMQMFFMYIHGCTDGFSRKIIYLQIRPDKKATTTSNIFFEGQYGLPRFVRMDKGGENVMIAEFMTENLRAHGYEHSVIVGASVRNTRIERFWREVNNITRPFKVLFYMMADEGILNTNDPIQRFCLHYIYIPRIQKLFDEFLNIWDSHSICTAGHKMPSYHFHNEPQVPTHAIIHQPQHFYHLENNEIDDIVEFASLVIPDPLHEDGNMGVDLYFYLVQAMYRLP